LNRAVGREPFLLRICSRRNLDRLHSQPKSKSCRRGSQYNRDAQFSWGASWVHRSSRGRKRNPRISRRLRARIGRDGAQFPRSVAAWRQRNFEQRRRRRHRKEGVMQIAICERGQASEGEPHGSEERKKSVATIDVAEAVTGSEGGGAAGENDVLRERRTIG